MALMLAFLLPGLGQIYAGRVKRGVLFLLIYAIVLIGVFSYFVNPGTRISFLILGLIPVGIGFSLYILVDAYQCAKQYNQVNNLARKISAGKRFFFIAGMLFFYMFNVSPIFINYIRSNVVQAFRLPTATMKPAIMQGDRILVDKAIYKTSEPQRGDIVVFIYPEDIKKIFVKRLIGLPGETVEIKDGRVLINGIALNDPSIASLYYYNRGDYAKKGQSIRIPVASYFVLGDNSAESMDSRYWGFVPRNYIQGKAFKIYYPFDRSGPIK